MTFAEVKELERLRVQDATSKLLKEFDAKQQEIDRTISRRSGGWHEARTNLAFERIAAGIDDWLAIRKAMIERCPALATPHEILLFKKSASSVIEAQFQGVLRSLPIMGVRPSTSVLSQVPAMKLALRKKFMSLHE